MSSLSDPQTFNLYAYCANDPINRIDPDGLGFFSFFKKLFKGIGKAVFAVAKAVFSVLSNKWVRLIIGVALLFLATPFAGALFLAEGAGAGGVISAITAGLLMAGVNTLGVISSHVRRQQEEVGGDCGTEDNPCVITIQVRGQPLGVAGPLIQVILRIIAGLFRGAGRLFRRGGAGRNVIRGTRGAVSREALREAAAGGGPTTRVATRLTQPPQVGRDLSAATGEGAEALANAARNTGQVYTAEIPNRLLVLIEDAGLLTRSTTMMGNVTAQEIRFSSLVSEYIVPFFR